MKKLVVLAFALLAAGCGGGSNADSVTNDTVATFNEVAVVFETSKDAADAKAKLEPLKTKLSDVLKRKSALKLSVEDEKKAAEKHQAEMAKAQDRVQTAAKKFAEKDNNCAREVESFNTFFKSLR